MSVIFPTYEVIKTRPNWLVLGGERTAYSVGSEICRNAFPCIVEAYYTSEGEDAVAADRALLNMIDTQTPESERVQNGMVQSQSRLFLRPGSYRLKVTDKNNRPIATRDVTIGGKQ